GRICGQTLARPVGSIGVHACPLPRPRRRAGTEAAVSGLAPTAAPLSVTWITVGRAPDTDDTDVIRSRPCGSETSPPNRHDPRILQIVSRRKVACNPNGSNAR